MAISRRNLLKVALAIPAGHFLSAPSLARGRGLRDAQPSLDDQLYEDAIAAWQFFEQDVDLLPGLLPAASWMHDKGVGYYGALTMWDVGSLILAYVSARRIGLVSDRQFSQRIAGVMKFLGRVTFRYKRKTLLNSANRASDGKPEKKGFDSTDTGRLLIALKVLDQFTDGSLAIDRLIAGWNIEATIRRGKMHDIKGGRMFSATTHLYANYVSRAYGLWGIEHKRPFEELSLESGPKAVEAILDTVRRTGAIATEPSVSEVIELGASMPARVIAVTLFAAQIKRHADTGILTCVSEGPLDREPWFAYQGYELGNKDGLGDGHWNVHSATTQARWTKKSFAEDFRMVSSKGAFLWLAARPCDYSDLLHNHVRSNAKSNAIGFSAGVYEKSRQAANVYDINTNAVILEAIAYIMNGRQPLLVPDVATAVTLPDNGTDTKLVAN